MTGEPRGVSRVVAGFSSFDREYSLPHVLAQGSPIFHSIMVFSNKSALHVRWLQYWSFSFSICPSNEYSGLVSFRIDWFGLLPAQGTLKSLLQHHGSKASILRHSALSLFCLSRGNRQQSRAVYQQDSFVCIHQFMSLNIHKKGQVGIHSDCWPLDTETRIIKH